MIVSTYSHACVYMCVWGCVCVCNWLCRISSHIPSTLQHSTEVEIYSHLKWCVCGEGIVVVVDYLSNVVLALLLMLTILLLIVKEKNVNIVHDQDDNVYRRKGHTRTAVKQPRHLPSIASIINYHVSLRTPLNIIFSTNKSWSFNSAALFLWRYNI